MGARWQTTLDNLPRMTQSIRALNGKKVQVGAMQGSHAWLAGIHEYGCTIKPKRAKYLTVPVHHKAVGKKARDFNNLWTLRADSGELFLCQNRGKDSFDVLFWLTKSVTIPERSFLRTGHDENIDRIIKQTERAIGQVIAGKMSADDMLDLYGKQMATAIKKKIRDISSPPNSSVTIDAKGSSNPLVDTEGLIESITWRKV